MVRKRQDPKAFRLRFQGTTAKKFAPTLKQANADAKYWLSFGQTKVCIDRKLPHSYQQVKCVLKRKGSLGGAPAWWPFGHKKPAAVAKKKRNPMTQRIMYIPQGPSGRMINKLAGAGRKRRRR